MLFRAGAKLQLCDHSILFFPIADGLALFTEVLLKNGAKPTMEMPEVGWTPMEIAVMYGQPSIVDLLRKYGVPLLERKVAAQLVLIHAAWQRDILRIDEAIRNGANVNEKNRKGETALIMAVDLGPLLFTPLNYGTISYLLEKGADPTIQGDRGFGKTTALHLAIDHSSLVFGKESESERMKDCTFWARKIIILYLGAKAIQVGD
jgi:ankyrin repeat protein